MTAPRPLDPETAAVLAVNEALEKQLAATSVPVTIALDTRSLARAALSGVDGLPRIPAYIDEPRAVGGRRAPDALAPDPTLRIVAVEPDRILVEAVVADSSPGDGGLVGGVATLRVDDAEQWLLAGLAACAEARRLAAVDDKIAPGIGNRPRLG